MSNLMQHIDLGDIIGGIAAIIFYGRFYLQWYVSERQKRSVVPVAFWYMSSVGALLLFGYGVFTHSAVGTLSYCFNIIVYSRNLIHIWRAKGTLSPRRSRVVHGLAGIIVVVAIILLVLTWLHVLKETPAEAASKTWFWIAVGVVGQGLFACRFLVQWLATERKRESVIPVSFWYFSLVAATLMFASYVQTREWIYAFGMASTLPIYARNLWMIRQEKVDSSQAE